MLTCNGQSYCLQHSEVGVAIRLSWAYEDGAPQMLYNKRTDLCHSEMPCTTFNL